MTDAEKLREYLVSMTTSEFLIFCRDDSIISIPTVIHEKQIPDLTEQVLALEENDPVQWTKALRAAGIRMYNAKLHPEIEAWHLQHRRDFIENWELYPPVKAQGLSLRPKPLYHVNEIWRLANKPACPYAPHPFEFEEFLRRDPHFQVPQHRSGNGSLGYELSPAGMRKRRWIDRGKRFRKSLWAAWHISGRVWRRIREATKHPVIATVLATVIIAIVANFVLKRFGLSLLP